MRIDARPRTEEPHVDLDARPRASPPPARQPYEVAAPAETPERVAFFAGLRAQAARLDAPSAPPSRDAIVGARLDALRDAFSGPYTVEGRAVAAAPMFRMNGGFNDRAGRAQEPALRAIATSTGAHPGMSTVGRGSPRDLVRTTQALIDHGHLPPPPGDVATRIRQMQWQWGIGVDCAGYAYAAIVAASGTSPQKLGLAPIQMENFRALDGLRTFTKVPLSSARPGDVITLDPRPPETVGHNVIVRSRSVVGSRHVLEVDSSWGAGPAGAEYGGFRRDTWIFDESTKLWTSFDVHVSPPSERVSAEGPAGERLHGCYRARVGT
jgi:hypothetical protein